MDSGKKIVTMTASAVLYFLFNLRLGGDLMATVSATLWQLLQTVPYVIGIVIIIVALLQYMAGGEKLPWDRRLRLFFAVGIIVGLFYAISEYAGLGNK
jgi:cytochrome c biogenesis protein CcdA